MPQVTNAAPVASGARITNLDTVRGVATLGILVMNAVSFGLPDAAYFNLDAAGSTTWLDWAIGVGGEIVVDQKTMALFSMLFGAGIVLFGDRASANPAAPGRPRGMIRRVFGPAGGLSLWRNLLLLGIGLVHSYFWEGDVLVVYAICAPVLLVLAQRSARTLVITGTALVSSSALFAVGAQTEIPPDGAGLGSYWFVDGGTIGDAAGLFLLADFFLRSLGMMLIGVALYRMDVMQGLRPAAYYQRMVRLGLAVGLPLAIAGVSWQLASDFAPGVALVGQAPNTLATIPLALAYLGLITLWNMRSDSALQHRVRAVGRMALTNYLSQTALGLAWFGHVMTSNTNSRTDVVGFVVAVWILQLLWSPWWLERFRFGPAEWLWRCATYRCIQPLRRAPPR